MAKNQSNVTTNIPVSGAATTGVKIQKHPATVPQPFTEGHSLRQNEAEALNSHYAVCVRNAVQERLKKLAEDRGVEVSAIEDAEVQKIVDEVTASYDFGAGGSGRGSDPVEREAVEIARESVRKAIRKKGQSPSQFSAKDITGKAKELMASEKYGEAIRGQARQIVEQREDVADIDI